MAIKIGNHNYINNSSFSDNKNKKEGSGFIKVFIIPLLVAIIAGVATAIIISKLDIK